MAQPLSRFTFSYARFDCAVLAYTEQADANAI